MMLPAPAKAIIQSVIDYQMDPDNNSLPPVEDCQAVLDGKMKEGKVVDQESQAEDAISSDEPDDAVLNPKSRNKLFAGR